MCVRAGCVVFADGATARRAIAGTGHPLAPEELSSAPDDMDQVMTDASLDPAGEASVLLFLSSWRKVIIFALSQMEQPAFTCCQQVPPPDAFAADSSSTGLETLC